MPGRAYSIFIGERALDKDKELLNPLARTEGIPPGETLISCKYTMELNSAGSCTFVMPPTHPYISEIQPMSLFSIPLLSRYAWSAQHIFSQCGLFFTEICTELFL